MSMDRLDLETLLRVYLFQLPRLHTVSNIECYVTFKGKCELVKLHQHNGLKI